MMDKTKLLRRRDWCAAGLGAAAIGVTAVGASAAEVEEPTLKSQFLFEMEAELEPPEDIGDRQIYIAKSGVIRGPRINATLLPGGGDWAKRRPDGSTMLDVRGTMKTDDGALIYTWYRGIIAPKDGGMYFRTTPYFETKSEKYAWLNHVVAVGVFKPVPGKVAYNVFEIL
jgi:hypothetical protein